MAGSVIAANNIGTAATFSGDTEDEDYPLANLADRQAANVYRAESSTLLDVIVNLGSAVEADAVAIVNHNFPSGATITLKADNSTPPTTVVATLSWREFNIWKSFAAISRQYWRLTVSASGSSALQAGQLVIGSQVALPRARRIGEGYSPERERSNLSGETYAGVFWNYHLFERARFNPVFRIAGAADLAAFDAIDRATYGNLFPFVYIPDVSGSDVYYVRKDEGFAPREFNVAGGGDIVHDYAMNLVEESRGLEVLE